MKDSTVSARVENNVKIEARRNSSETGSSSLCCDQFSLPSDHFITMGSIFINDSFRTSNH